MGTNIDGSHRSRPRTELAGVAVVLVLLVAALTGCSGNGGGSGGATSEPDVTAPPEPGGSVSYGLSLGIDGLNPVSNQWNSSNLNVGKAIYDPLVVLDQDGIAVPYLVESIEPNDDFTEWTITARDGVTFHNGDPLTAYEIASHIKNVQLGPLTGFGLRVIDAVGVVDEVARPQFDAGDLSEEEYDLMRRQVVVFMNEPWSSFSAFLASLQLGYVAHPDFESGEIDTPIGTGPFELDEFVPDDHVTVVRNDEYWRAGLPYLDEIRFELLLDPTTRFQALQAGDVDMINTQAMDQVVDLSTDSSTQETYQRVDDASDGDELVVMLNTQASPTSDLDVRRALQLATDREALNQGLYDDFYDLADAPFRRESRWYSDPGWPAPDTDAAAALVEEWEADNGPLEIELTTLPASDLLELAQVLADQWEQAGIGATINTIDVAQAGTIAATGDYQAFIWNFFFGSDPDEHYPFWDPAPGGPGEISINFTRYTSDTVDRVMHGARETGDPDERAALYADLWTDFAENVPYLWLMHINWLVLTEPTIHGLDSFTTPDGDPAAGHVWGSVFFTEAWVEQ